MSAHDLSCRELDEVLMAYLDEEMDAAARAAFEAHLQQCPECLAYLDSYRRTVALARACGARGDDPANAEEVPERLLEAVLAARRHR
jgi:anti-sigma factor RsiW